MTRESVRQKVFMVVADQLGKTPEELKVGLEFVKDLNADSLDSVELVMKLEEEFDITIPDDQTEKLQTIGAVIDHVCAQLKITD